MTAEQSNKVVAGIDVASEELVVRVSSDGQIRRYANTAKGIRELMRQLGKLKVTLVVCEHSGRHEWALLEALWALQISVHCAHPRAIRNFAKALKANIKSDPQDALTLMEYGLRMEAPPTPRPASEACLLRDLAARRYDLNDMLVKERNRLQAPGVPPAIKTSIKNHLRQLQAAIEALEEQVKALVASCPELQRPISRLDEEYGVGLVSAAAIYSSMPELGTMTRQTSASLAGLAPFVRESGKYSGQRKIRGGRTQARVALYMVALTVIRKADHPLRAVYLRLKAAGKHTSVALTAVMRKLIIRFNTVLKELRAQEQIIPISC